MKPRVPYSWMFLALGIAFATVGAVLTRPDSTPDASPDAAAPAMQAAAASRDEAFARMLEDGVAAVLAEDQPAGSEVRVASLSLSQPGFVVIQEDRDGVPGPIIGVSERLIDGAEPLLIETRRALVPGEVYYAVVYADRNLDGAFSPIEDTMLLNRSSEAILMSFKAE